MAVWESWTLREILCEVYFSLLFFCQIMSELVSNGVQIYQFPVDDETVADLNSTMNVSAVGATDTKGTSSNWSWGQNYEITDALDLCRVTCHLLWWAAQTKWRLETRWSKHASFPGELYKVCDSPTYTKEEINSCMEALTTHKKVQ